MTPTPSIDRMPALLAYYADRLEPKDKTPLLMRKARLGIVDEPLAKGGKPGGPGLYQKVIADKHGKKVTHWVHLPKGKPAAHNDKQAELFNINGTPYESLETRPDTTDKQRRIGVDALAALKRRVNLLRDSGGSAATLLGARLYASFVASGHTQLTGQKITSPEDLAALAQVYRDPRFETFRCVFLKGDEVVGESAYSSRLPGTVRLPDDYTRQVEADFKRFGATGYYMLHNHPSGRAKPSTADERLTENLNFAVPGMVAHVIIDHHEYGLITKGGRVQVIQKPDLAGPDYHASPSLEHPMLGVTIDNPAVIALAAKALQSELMGGSPILVMTKGFESRVDVLASVPHALIDTLSDKMPRAKAWLRGIGRASGAGSHVFLIVSDADYDNRKDVLRHLVSAGLLTDVVSPGGKSIMLHEYVPYHGKKLFDDRRHGHKVAESLADDLEAQEKYLTDGAKKLGYESIDDLAVNDYDAFERLAAQWRMDHPVETALYQPVAEYGGPFKAPEVRNAAGELLAPNGEPSKLTDGQWHQVRSPAFKEWFGDWERLAKTIDPVTLVLEGWTGSKEDLRLLAQGWYSENLQGKPPTINEDMGVPVMFASEGKSTAFATSGNLRTGWKAEMVRALPELVQRAIKVQEVAPDARRLRDTQMFHTLVAPLSVAGKTYSAKITIREALERVASAPHKFYDIAALEINNGPEVYGLKDSEHVQNPLPTPSEPLGMTVRQLASAVNGLDFESGVSKVVDANGEPKVLYHGTTRDIDRYDPKTDQRLPGFWMAPTPELANTYASGGVVNPRGYPSGANVVPVFVKAEKLRVFDGRKESMMHVWDAYQNGDFNGFVELGFTGDVYAYSVKKPTQIKSAIGNNGAFDGTNPIMTKAQPRIIFFKKAKA